MEMLGDAFTWVCLLLCLNIPTDTAQMPFFHLEQLIRFIIFQTWNEIHLQAFSSRLCQQRKDNNQT